VRHNRIEGRLDVNTEAPRRRLARSALLATAVTGLALVGSGVHGLTTMDGSLERAAAQRDARQAEQLREHREAELGARPRPYDAKLRFRDVRDRRDCDREWAPKRRQF
jgi:hypothetical protein